MQSFVMQGNKMLEIHKNKQMSLLPKGLLVKFKSAPLFIFFLFASTINIITCCEVKTFNKGYKC